MKHLLLFALAASLATGSASAQTFTSLGADAPVGAPAKSPTESGYTIQFSGNISDWTLASTDENIDYRVYIPITADITSRMAGNQVTALTFSAVLQSTDKLPGTIFITEDLDGQPVVSTPIEVVNSYNAQPASQTAEFNQPYTIEADRPFWVGYTVEGCRSNDYPVGVDSNPATPFAGSVSIYKDGQLLAETPMSVNGRNVFMAVHTVGDVRTLNNLLVINSVKFPSTVKYTLPCVAVGEELKVTAGLQNLGENAVKTFEYCFIVNGVRSEIFQYQSTAMGAKRTYSKTLNAFTVAEGRNTVEVEIISVNDQPFVTSSAIGCYGFPENLKGYDRNILVEKGTGTWCGYCPYGIMGFDAMAEKFPEVFIPVDVHTGDEFSVASYLPVANAFSGVPGSIINRDPKSKPYPNAANLETAINGWLQQPCPGRIDIQQASLTDEGIAVTVNTEYLFPETDARYAVAFAIAENGLTGVQNNYLAGNASAGVWGTYPAAVRWTYSHTARDLFTYDGLPDSQPSTIEAGKKYSYTYTVGLQNVSDPMQTYIVAMLMDRVTGCVINSARIDASAYSGIDSPVVDNPDASAPVEYFNLQGQRVTNPRGGIFIRRQGSTATKVAVN